jgi:hypothetical protein
LSPTIDVTDVVHFFSYETGVSIELPVGFEEQFEDHGVAGYVDDPEDEDAGPVTARVIIQVVGAIESGSPDTAEAAVAGLAQGFAGQGGEVIGRRQELIDDDPTETVIQLRTDETLGGALVVHQTAAATGGHLLSITALAAAADRATAVPAYDRAIRSMRFISL